jgi:dipeptidyl aminopeptidase/acylaminoacyl peptidase
MDIPHKNQHLWQRFPVLNLDKIRSSLAIIRGSDDSMAVERGCQAMS